MRKTRTAKLLTLITSILATIVLSVSSTLAQCAMCKNAVAGSPSAARLSESLNSAIIVLLIPPVLIFCGIFLVAYRYGRARRVEPPARSDDKLPGPKEGIAKPGALQNKKPGRAKRETGGALA